MTHSLSGKVAAITGAARGIGDTIAARFLADGATVFALDKMAPDQPRAGVTYLQTDVTDPESIAAAFKAIDSQAGELDILVNNAGIQRIGLVGKVSFADFSAVVSTHLNGFFLCASERVPRMVKRGKGGAVVSIASTAAFVGLPGRGAYCAAKAGMLGLTRALSLEVATARVPMKRLATTEEIANAVRFLSGDEATYMTGQTIVVDGGWIVQGIPEAPTWLQTPAS